jgi:uncharacterized protein (TIGR02271 family)
MIMYDRTLTALYDDAGDAQRARQDLIAAGIPEQQVWTHKASATTATGTTAGRERDEGGFWEALKDLFVPDEDRYTYAEGMRRGGTLLSVRVPENLVDRACEVLEASNPVDLDTREGEWRQSGWAGYQSSAYGATSTSTAGSSTETRSGLAGAAMAPGAAAAAGTGVDAGTVGSTTTAGKAGGGNYARTAETGRDEVIPVVEEDLRVGKREVDRGSVRVRSYVVETPVQENVALRDESVHVERRPVDRDLSPGETAPFEERTIDVTETDEEAVVSKTPRVKEEIHVQKDVDQRTETVSDKTRRTEVEVEDTRTDRDLAKDARTNQRRP